MVSAQQHMTKPLDPNTIPPVEITAKTLEECLAACQSGIPVVVPRHVASQLAKRFQEMRESHESTRQQEFVSVRADFPPLLRSGPIRFAVKLTDGSAGSMWKVEARGRGEVYIIPRDIMEGAKISLHASGRQHLKVDRPPWDKMKWKEPPRESPLPASVKLLFTVWSAGMGPTKNHDAAQVQKQWEQNQVLIEGEDSEDSVITVCFFLTPPDVRVELPPRPPMARFAALSVGADKNLHIIARKEHRPNLRVAIEQRLAETVASHTVSARWPIGRKSVLLLGGDDVDGRPYVTPVSVEMTEQGVKLMRCRRAFVGAPHYVR